MGTTHTHASYCFLIATQTNTDAQFILLQLGDDNDCIFAVSLDGLISMCKQEEIKLCNTTLADIQSGKLPQDIAEYSELQLSARPLILEHPCNLWVILDLLIQENAKFKIPGLPNRVFTFSDISFSMKTDEVSISYYDKDKKVTYVLWSTPKLDAISDCGSILVSCSSQLKQKILGKSKAAHAVADTTSYFSASTDDNFFMINLSHLTCTWDTRYCLKRFHRAELSSLLSMYEHYRAITAGIDLAEAFKSTTALAMNSLFSHINGKSLSSSSTVSFVVALNFPDILKMGVLLQSNREEVTKICNSDNSLFKLKSYILSNMQGVIDNSYLNTICGSFISALQNQNDSQSLESIQATTTGLACRIFQYKMAYVNPVISVPSKVPFKDGTLLIYKGGTLC